MKRIVLGLAALFLAASLLFAYLVTPAAPPAPRDPADPGAAPPAPPRGEPLFRAHCGGCHTTGELLPGLLEAQTREASRAELLDFLDGHGAATPEEDRAIAEHLLDLAWPP